jgi:uncharacterized membrane protein
MIVVKVFTKENCTLCEETKEALLALQATIPHQLVEINIEDKNDRHKGKALPSADEIPIVEVGPYRLKAPISPQDLEITLRAAAERERDIQSISSSGLAVGKPITRGDRFTYWFSRHYILLLNLIVIVYLGLPFLAPVLMAGGLPGPAGILYKVYGAVCHQFAFRSWFLFGEQAAYPRQSANVPGLIPYGQATGLPEEDQFASRAFIGNPNVGYKVALCQRDVAIYGGILIFGAVFGLSGRRLKSLPWYLWIVIGMLPIAADGLSQLLSQPPLNAILPLAYRESTPFLRTLTGFLFGFTTAWFGYPLVEDTMRESRRYLEEKISRSENASRVDKQPAIREGG